MNIKALKLFIPGLLIACTLAGCIKPSQQQGGGNTYHLAGGSTPYPVETDITLTYWGGLHTSVAAQYSNLGDTPLYKELQKRTGIKINFLHYPFGMQGSQFDLMLSSGQYTDILEYPWNEYPGGPDKAIRDNIITPLNDYLPEYAPNLKGILDADPELNESAKSNNGEYYMFPFIRGDESLLVYTGPAVRKDWLDDLGLGIPTTIDEWYRVLSEFKQKKGAHPPLTMFDYNRIVRESSVFVGAYGIKDDFYLDDSGRIVYGPLQPQYKEYLATMHKWYQEGLLDENFAVTSATAADKKILSGNCGAVVGYAGDNIGKYLGIMKNIDARFNMVATPYPTLIKGEKPKYGQRDLKISTNGGVGISAASKYKELCAIWLDYAYGAEGNRLFNFGIEGESYEMMDGLPTYTEKITNNPEGLSMGQALGAYVRSNYYGPFVQDKGYMEQYAYYPQQKQAIQTWMDTEEQKHMLNVYRPASMEENNEYSTLLNDVTTYKNDMVAKFILGIESLDNFDAFVRRLKDLGAERIVEIRQNSYNTLN